ncbi:hypothetical protein HYH03_012234 [Edaphochlamys debaryana]|uniref:GH16 domain-containing protein n=1 Tax=Edaphochlamys debaryana TaxID=47281 RepID=A0A835XT50_9CHLO|nr:hypothetical protein HYH03_012234 [Edaphochlamys debaryana]|eukprot:KAG2489210.1 hypothetical protein HYH03_012234 [Edaphochlamys debaryana]
MSPGRGSTLLAVCLVAGLACARAEYNNSGNACVQRLNSQSPNTNSIWIDKDTPSSACTKNRCRSEYYSCLGESGWPSRWKEVGVPPRNEDMVLVFSDEFDDPNRDFALGKDYKWQALDLLYVNNDQAVFLNKGVSISNGKLVLTATNERNKAPVSTHGGDFLSGEMPYTSGAVQGWNKFCFTGGYMEVSVKMPGDNQKGGFWPSVFTLGNLGRAGYLRSTEGVWPHSYNTCDAIATQKFINWSNNTQRINRCNNTQGRGAPEIDLFEVGVWHEGDAELSTSLPIAPLIPNGLNWLDEGFKEDAMQFATWDSPDLRSRPNPYQGDFLADYVSGVHNLNASYFTSFQRFGLDWQPGEYIRWYINDVLIQEINKKALVARTNLINESVAERFIPLEPSYVNIFLAMSNTFAPIAPDVPLPATMEVDYIRIWQQKDQINIGCSPPDFPTQDYINKNRDMYLASGVPGFTDFVGDSSVIGPIGKPPPPRPPGAGRPRPLSRPRPRPRPRPARHPRPAKLSAPRSLIGL